MDSLKDRSMEEAELAATIALMVWQNFILLHFAIWSICGWTIRGLPLQTTQMSNHHHHSNICLYLFNNRWMWIQTRNFETNIFKVITIHIFDYLEYLSEVYFFHNEVRIYLYLHVLTNIRQLGTYKCTIAR